MNSADLSLVNQIISSHIKKVSCKELHEIFDHHFSSQGKQLRPLVTLKIAQCFGANPELVAPWAALCEVLHNGTLIHDDLQDGDQVRRDKPTVWKEYGALQAINAGDMLLLSPPILIDKLNVGENIKWQLSLLYAKSSSRIVYGQALEPSLINLLDSPGLSDVYYECIGAKTSELFKMCAEGAGIILNLPEEQTKELSKAWFDLGLVFQIQDDLLDVYGDKGRKEIGCDIKEGKVSSLIVELLKAQPKLSGEISTILKTPRGLVSTKQVKHITNLFKENNVQKTLNNTIFSYKKSIIENKTIKNNNKLLDFTNEIFNKILEPISHLNNISNS